VLHKKTDGCKDLIRIGLDFSPSKIFLPGNKIRPTAAYMTLFFSEKEKESCANSPGIG